MRFFVPLFVMLMVVLPAFAKPAELMPPPQKAPRAPVERQSLKDQKEQKEFEGKAKAVDGERLIINDTEVRLFGIVTPSLSSNFGPQARNNLDQMLQANVVLCKTTDRDREARPIAFCGTVDVPDISYEMLKRGWAMVDRKAIKGSPLVDVYEKAEQEALTANKGLFAPQSLTNVVPLSNPAKAVVVPEPKPEEKTLQAKPEAKATEAKPEPAVPPPVLVPAPPEKMVPAQIDLARQPSFIERFQTLISAMLILCAAGVVAGGFVVRGREAERERRRALAAALRGELMAARHICRTRARELSRRKPEGDAARVMQYWPRMRAFVYQAHVGSIGILGAELARQVASIYGQCADYAAYYGAQQRLPANQVVAETLGTLADHMEIVLENLSVVEATGRPYRLEAEDLMPQVQAEIVDDHAASAAPATPVPSPKRGRKTAAAEQDATGLDNVLDEVKPVQEKQDAAA